MWTLRKPSRSKVAQRSPQLLGLLAHDVRTESTVRTITVSLVAKLFRQVKNNGDRKAVILASQSNDRLAGFDLYVRGIDHNQLPGRQPFGGDEVQTSKASFVAA